MFICYFIRCVYVTMQSCVALADADGSGETGNCFGTFFKARICAIGKDYVPLLSLLIVVLVL